MFVSFDECAVSACLKSAFSWCQFRIQARFALCVVGRAPDLVRHMRAIARSCRSGSISMGSSALCSGSVPILVTTLCHAQHHSMYSSNLLLAKELCFQFPLRQILHELQCSKSKATRRWQQRYPPYGAGGGILEVTCLASATIKSPHVRKRSICRCRNRPLCSNLKGSMLRSCRFTSRVRFKPAAPPTASPSRRRLPPFRRPRRIAANRHKASIDYQTEAACAAQS